MAHSLFRCYIPIPRMLPSQVPDIVMEQMSIVMKLGGLTGRDSVGKRVVLQCPESPRGGLTGRDTVGGADQVFHYIPEQVDVDEQVFHEDKEQKIPTLSKEGA